MFNEHFNYGESARTLRSFIADVTTELCNLDKQPISTIGETRELIEVKYFNYSFDFLSFLFRRKFTKFNV
jgi:hypothetical protein